MSKTNIHPSPARKYLYCIISHNESTSDADFAEGALNGRQVSTIKFRDIAAVVSDLTNQDINWIRSAIHSRQQEGMDYFISHQKVVEACRSAGFVTLPVRFGSIVTEKNLKQLFQKQYPSYKEKILQLRNKDEYGVRLLIGPKTEERIGRLLSQQTDISELMNQIRSKSTGPGASYFDKLRLRDMIRSRRFRLVDAAIINIHNELMTIAESTSTLSKDTSDTVLNRAYLVDRGRAREFAELLESATHGQSNPLELRMHRSGPWAPYSFCMEPNPHEKDVLSQSSGRSRRSTKHSYRLIKRQPGGSIPA